MHLQAWANYGLLSFLIRFANWSKLYYKSQFTFLHLMVLLYSPNPSIPELDLLL